MGLRREYTAGILPDCYGGALMRRRGAVPATEPRIPLPDGRGSVFSVHAEQSHSWLYVPEAAAHIPDFYAVDEAALAGQLDRARYATRRNVKPDLDRHCAAVPVVDHDAIEIDRSTLHAELDRTEQALIFTYFDLVVIGGSIHVRVPEH